MSNFSVTSAPGNFSSEEKDFINEGIKRFHRTGEIVAFLKGHYGKDVKDLHKRHDELRMHLHSVQGAITVSTGAAVSEEKPIAPAKPRKPRKAKKK